MAHPKKAIVAALLFVFCASILFGACGAVPPPFKKTNSVSATATHPISCAETATPTVMLITDRKQQCIIHAQGENNDLQLLASPTPGVKRLCDFGEAAWASYASYEDPIRKKTLLHVDTIGSISVWMDANTCQTVQQAVGIPSLEVTDILWDSSELGDRQVGTPTPSLTHQVQACQKATLIVWYNDGGKKACYTAAGFLQLPHPLEEVVRLCAGTDTGEISWSIRKRSSILLTIGPSLSCVSPQQVLGLRAMAVNGIDIAPVN